MSWMIAGAVGLLAAVLWINSLYSTKRSGNLLLGVTLPRDQLINPIVLQIITNYRRACAILYPTALLAFFPVVCFVSSMAYLILCLFLWMGLLLFLSELLYLRYNRRLAQLKKQQGWLVGRQHLVVIDTRVTRLNRSAALSYRWYVFPLILSLSPVAGVFFVRPFPGSAAAVSTVLPLALTGVCLAMHRLFLSRPAAVYSTDSETNRACRALYERSWSVCWVACAYSNAVLFSTFYFIAFALPIDSNPWLGILPLLCVLCFSSLLFVTQDHIRRKQNLLIDAQEHPVYIDEDEYWVHGFYCNPHNTHVMVERREGIGFTLNLATVWGKILAGIMTVVLMVAVVGSSTMLFVLESAQFDLQVQSGSVQISAPLYSTSFAKAEIQEVALSQELPPGNRIDGAVSEEYHLGRFYLPDYGNGLLFIHNNQPPYLMIRLPDRTIWINGETPEQTREYYRLLTT